VVAQFKKNRPLIKNNALFFLSMCKRSPFFCFVSSTFCGAAHFRGSLLSVAPGVTAVAEEKETDNRNLVVVFLLVCQQWHA
jgi:hypothetical protein